MTMYKYGETVTTVKPSGWATAPSSFGDMNISLHTENPDTRRASIEKDLEDDARELSEIDGMPAPPKINITGSTLSSSAIWEEPIHLVGISNSNNRDNPSWNEIHPGPSHRRAHER